MVLHLHNLQELLELQDQIQFFQQLHQQEVEEEVDLQLELLQVHNQELMEDQEEEDQE